MQRNGRRRRRMARIAPPYRDPGADVVGHVGGGPSFSADGETTRAAGPPVRPARGTHGFNQAAGVELSARVDAAAAPGPARGDGSQNRGKGASVDEGSTRAAAPTAGPGAKGPHGPAIRSAGEFGSPEWLWSRLCRCVASFVPTFSTLSTSPCPPPPPPPVPLRFASFRVRSPFAPGSRGGPPVVFRRGPGRDIVHPPPKGGVSQGPATEIPPPRPSGQPNVARRPNVPPAVADTARSAVLLEGRASTTLVSKGPRSPRPGEAHPPGRRRRPRLMCIQCRSRAGIVWGPRRAGRPLVWRGGGRFGGFRGSKGGLEH